MAQAKKHGILPAGDLQVLLSAATQLAMPGHLVLPMLQDTICGRGIVINIHLYNTLWDLQFIKASILQLSRAYMEE